MRSSFHSSLVLVLMSSMLSSKFSCERFINSTDDLRADRFLERVVIIVSTGWTEVPTDWALRMSPLSM